MSTQTLPELTPERVKQAREETFQRIEVPVWLNKLAQCGIQPQTDAECQRLLDVGMEVAGLPDDHPCIKAGMQLLRGQTPSDSSPLENLAKQAFEFLSQDEGNPQESALAKSAEVVQNYADLAEHALVLFAARNLPESAPAPAPAA